MANNPNTPVGLSPIRRTDGARWVDSLTMYFIPAAYTQAVYVGDPVTKVAASANSFGVNAVNLTSAGASNPLTGVVCGFAGINTAGVGTLAPSFWGVSNTPGPVYRPASTAYDYYVLVNDDPFAAFLIQANNYYGGTVGAIAPATIVGKNANFIGQIATTTTLTSGSATFTVASATGIQVGMLVATTNTALGLPNAALGIPIGTTVTAISGTTVTISTPATASGAGINLLFNGGNPYTGLSGVQLDTNTVATTNTLQLSILGFLQEADNVPGSGFPKLVVRINQHTEDNLATTGI